MRNIQDNYGSGVGPGLTREKGKSSQNSPYQYMYRYFGVVYHVYLFVSMLLKVLVIMI